MACSGYDAPAASSRARALAPPLSGRSTPCRIATHLVPRPQNLLHWGVKERTQSPPGTNSSATLEQHEPPTSEVFGPCALRRTGPTVLRWWSALTHTLTAQRHACIPIGAKMALPAPSPSLDSPSRALETLRPSRPSWHAPSSEITRLVTHRSKRSEFITL